MATGTNAMWLGICGHEDAIDCFAVDQTVDSGIPFT